MKRLWWLLAVPYVVFHAVGDSYCIGHSTTSDHMICLKGKELSEDLAAALNEAHERRVVKQRCWCFDSEMYPYSCDCK